MIDRIDTAQRVAAILATMVAWWNLGLHRLVFSPELAPIHARIKSCWLAVRQRQGQRQRWGRRRTMPGVSQAFVGGLPDR